MDCDILNKLKLSTADVGDVFFLALGEEDGITPQDGYDTRNKFIVVLGKDDNGDLILSTAINTKSHEANEQMRDFQYPLLHSKYDFLKYTSFVNCYQYLRDLNIEKLENAEYKGRIDDEDMANIKQLIIDSPLSKRKVLRRFKLIK